jgi:shikimate kinase
LAATGRTVKEISLADGTETLHRFEDEALFGALQSRTPAVIGVAGGALLRDTNRALLRGEPNVVWLRATLETLATRIGMKGDRPYFTDDPVGTIAELYEVRRPLYAEVATFTIDVDDCTPEEIVAEILAAVHL